MPDIHSTPRQRKCGTDSSFGPNANPARHALNVDMVALSCVDRYGNQSKPFVFELKPSGAGATVSVRTNGEMSPK